MLVVNADDLGWTREISDRILACYRHRRIHTVSAMTFMNDSERAADLAQGFGLPVGLHLNLTQDFTGKTVSAKLREQHRSVATYLRARKANQILFNPFLCKSFDYVFKAQCDEFCRLYGAQPIRLDGHHHMHLSMNMIFSTRITKGIKVRRNFTFRRGEKAFINRLYRYILDSWLAKNFRVTNYFFSIVPIEPARLNKIFELSKKWTVELMVHPGVKDEYQYLLSDKCQTWFLDRSSVIW
jgi:chitin disaccharide deacetylase